MPNTTVRDPSGARPAFGVAKFVDGDTDPTKAGFNVNSSAAVELWDAAGVVRQSIGATTMDIKDSAGVARFSYTASATTIKDSGGNSVYSVVNAVAGFGKYVWRVGPIAAAASEVATTVATFTVPNANISVGITAKVVAYANALTSARFATTALNVTRVAGSALPTPGISAAGVISVATSSALGAMTAAVTAPSGGAAATNTFTMTVLFALGTTSASTYYVEFEIQGLNADQVTVA